MRFIVHPVTALVVVLLLGAAGAFGIATNRTFGYVLLVLAALVLVIVIGAWWRRHDWRVQWPLTNAPKAAAPVRGMDYRLAFSRLQHENQQQMQELNLFGGDAPARKYRKQVDDAFPDVLVGAADQIRQLVDYAYRHPFVDVPLTCAHLPGDEANVYTVDLYPISYVFKRPFGEASIIQTRLRKLVDDAKQDAYNDAKLKPPESS